MFSLKPRENKFFDLLEESARTVDQGARVFQSLMADYRQIGAKMAEITEVEHSGDELTARISDQLNQTFITPIDREDIYTLSNRLDDILDYIHGTIERMQLYQTGEPSPEIKRLVDILVKTTGLLVGIVESLRSIRKQQHKIIEGCALIKRCESDADHLYRRVMARLFREMDQPLELIKWKEIIEHIEEAIDACEHVAKIIKGVAMKNA
ncbi:MAG: DUF47 family protein [Heliobacteriaceae bacterium]|nr:DUF47 family protein [Heliobacteriaceae bacterium]MDD4586928.1 DUF47 family protein [Heliobacteriaceae bacterium]